MAGSGVPGLDQASAMDPTSPLYAAGIAQGYGYLPPSSPSVAPASPSRGMTQGYGGIDVAPTGGGNLITSQNLSGPGYNLTTTNPGSLDPNSVNPYASGDLNSLQGFNSQYNNLYGQYGNLASQFQNSMAGGAFNNNLYQGMQQRQQQQLTTSMANQYANMGLSGSAAESGNMQNAIQGSQMAWLNRQQSDQMNAINGLEGIYGRQQGIVGAQTGLEQLGYGQTMGMQNQYEGFQQASNQNQLGLLGMQQAQQAANNQMWGQIIGGGLTAAGTIGGAMVGGPAGAMIGSQLGGAVGQSFNSSGNNLPSYWDQAPQMGSQYSPPPSY